MYEMLTGRTPYDGETPVAVAIKHINANAAAPRSINPDIPVGMEQITMHAMAADLDARYENATEMLADLDEFRRNPKINFNDTSSPLRSVPSLLNAVPSWEKKNVKKEQARSKQRATGAKEQHSNNSATLIAGIICIMLALVFIGGILYLCFSEFFKEKIEVPSFIGMDMSEIEQNQYSDFKIEIYSTQTSDADDIGKVIKQDPISGESVNKGTVVSLTVSSGPSTNVMPDLKNETEKNARTRLTNLGLNLQIESHPESSDSIEKGTVIRTIPEAGENLSAGQAVALIVSAGNESDLGILMPELRGKDIEEAKQFFLV